VRDTRCEAIGSICAFLLLFGCLAEPAHSVPDDLPSWSVPFAASLCRQETLTTAAIATSMYVHGLADYKMETASDKPVSGFRAGYVCC